MNCRLYRRCVLLLAFLWLPFSAWSYLCRTFDAKALSEQAAIVCKVAVIALETSGTYTDGSFNPPLKTTEMLARVKCVATIKGTPAATFNIAYPGSTPTVAYTRLATGEVCIVFLDIAGGTPRFVDVHNGKMPCSAAVVPYDMGDTARDRMLCELLALCRSTTGANKLLGTEYLGQLADPRAKSLLEAQSQSADPTLRGAALTSLIEIGAAPSMDQLLSYLNQNPDSFDASASLTKCGTSAYTITALASRIMRAIETSIKVKQWHRDMVTSRPSATLDHFDYLSFFDKALATRLVQADPMMRQSLAEALRKLADERSIPLLRKLLDDSTVDVRYYAVTALTRVHKGGPFPSVDTFSTNETAYVGYWKDRIKYVEESAQ